MRVAHEMELTDEEREELTILVRSGLTTVRLVERARMVLLAAEEMQNKGHRRAIGRGVVRVSRWRERYAQSRWRALSMIFHVALH